ncbi:MAG: hypothetical protein GF405_01220, partial [Candidatus Eisenbacteria bacterium]|nr:hypothetical protein [Candidatus Eisenbacteria bacterium]
MKTIVACLMAVVLVVPAFADDNPDGRVFVSGAIDSNVDQIDVPAGVPFNMYLAVDCLDDGLRGVAVTMLH